jgi:hypothetical protein
MLDVHMSFPVFLIRRFSGKSNQPASTIVKWSLAGRIETFCNHAASLSSRDWIPLFTKTAVGNEQSVAHRI